MLIFDSKHSPHLKFQKWQETIKYLQNLKYAQVQTLGLERSTSEIERNLELVHDSGGCRPLLGIRYARREAVKEVRVERMNKL